MEFGRIPHIEKIDFSLPVDAVMTEQVLGQAAPDNLAPLRCYVGGTGWGQPNWIGKAYPGGTKPKDFLLQYARQFNSIELNALWQPVFILRGVPGGSPPSYTGRCRRHWSRWSSAGNEGLGCKKRAARSVAG
jgi:hypothetical protein